MWPPECNRSSINRIYSLNGHSGKQKPKDTSLSPIPPSLFPPITHTHTHTYSHTHTLTRTHSHSHTPIAVMSWAPLSLPLSHSPIPYHPGEPWASCGPTIWADRGGTRLLFIHNWPLRSDSAALPARPRPLPPAPLSNPTFILMK